ncbi:CHAT domain-containing protein [Foetidibacter luteolus]|uniref:CHAT domain-containing protein n=1 Tax=Foetidibacter luteolus TaxID=2608880 RepID=UPI00129ADFAE|nr:CHAT domain-containing protein [Foetidibacter luteolus]
MNTIVIEILRTGQAVNELLDTDINYIALCGAQPAKDLVIACRQDEFNERITLLRYNNNDEAKRQEGISFFQQLVDGVIDQIYPTGMPAPQPGEWLHLRLVTTPKEMAQIPFEIALTPQQIQQTDKPLPFFLNPQYKTTLTREVRRIAFAHYKWPVKPRILFAWAEPRATVPHEEHLAAFVEVLRPWALPVTEPAFPVQPNLGALVTELRDASLNKIKDAVTKAVKEGKPYTHIHLLAHGTKNDDPQGEQFLLLLCGEAGKRVPYKATGPELEAALMITDEQGRVYCPQIVSLVACDSGAMGSPVNPAGSLAHHLHQVGVPCVFASQFPLTQQGSVNLVTALYTCLLESSDPRKALYFTREKLDAGNVHDWASLVAYARFPEDVDEQMKDVELRIKLEFMKTSNALTDHVLKHLDAIKDNADEELEKVSQRMEKSIADLTALVQTAKGQKSKERFAEHYGLIGSAYKRKAEHLFRMAGLAGEAGVPAASLEALALGKDWYYRAYNEFLYSHWTGTQYLSLQLVLTGTLTGEEERDMWTLCRIMAMQDEKKAANNETLAWAYGTLAELYLLRPFTYAAEQQSQHTETALLKAKSYIAKLNELKDQLFPQESTARQLERYIKWWVHISTAASNQLQQTATTLRNGLEVVV